MRRIYTITVRDVILTVRERHKEQYAQYADDWEYGYPVRHPIGRDRKALAALDLATCSAADVHKILPGWAELTCDICKSSAPALVHMGDEPDYDATCVDACENCLNAALAKLKELKS